MPRAQHKPHRALAFIAAFKLLKAALLLIAAAGALRLLKDGALDGLVDWLARWPLASGHRPIVHLIHWLGGLSPRNLEAAAGLAFAYAALYTTEGIGLWLRKRWAEYLTTIATASLIPFELWELAHGASIAKTVALLLNVAIVVYLAWVLRADRA